MAIEYCGQNEPLVRSFEPLNADNRASKSGSKSHQSAEVVETAQETRFLGLFAVLIKIVKDLFHRL